MPSQHGVRLDEHQCGAPAVPGAGQKDPEQPVLFLEVRSSPGAMQGTKLVPERDVFEDQFPMPAAGQGQRSRDQYDHVQHPVIVPCVAYGNQPRPWRMAFWRMTATGP